MKHFFLFGFLLLLNGCVPVTTVPVTPPPVTAPALKADWDGATYKDKVTGKTVVVPAEEYTKLLVAALKELGGPLLQGEYQGVCGEKMQWWVMFISSMAHRESNFNPNDVYRESFGTNSIGLLQMSVSDNHTIGCSFKTEADVKDPKNNLRCGVATLAKWVSKHGVVAEGSVNSNARGGAMYWSVIREGSNHYKAEIFAKARATCK